MKKHRILPIFLAVLLCLCTQMNAAAQPDISTDTPLYAAAEAGEGFSDAFAVSDNVSTDAPASALVASMSAAANAALLVDMDTDYIMYAQNAFERIYPASITKVMTALLVLDAVDDGTLALDDVVTAGETAWDGLDYTSSNQNIRAGEQMRVEDLLYCLMLASANEAGNILAVAVSGSIAAFVEQMNLRAAELGCADTHFTNPHGMPDSDHYTTAYDIYLMAKAAMQNEEFRKIVGTAEYTVSATNLSGSRYLCNTNGLISEKKYSGYLYEYCTGIKTGSTTTAGYCLLSSAEKDGQTLLCVMMGCENPAAADGSVSMLQFSESARLLDWGFSSFSTREILRAGESVAEVTVTLSRVCESVSVIAERTVTAQLPNDVSNADIVWTIDLPASVEAPVEAGAVLGTMENPEYGTVRLLAASGAERSSLLVFQQWLKGAVHSAWFWIAAILLFVCILLSASRSAARRRRRRRNACRGRH